MKLKRIVCYEEDVPVRRTPTYRRKIKFDDLDFGNFRNSSFTAPVPITFDPYYDVPLVHYKPVRKIVRKPKPKLNKKGQFLVELTEKNVYLPKLVEKAQNLGLSVSGDGSNPVKGGDITNAKKGDLVTFGTSSRFDVNWIRRAEYALENGYAPIYDVVKDWNTVSKAMKEFASKGQQKSFALNNGGNVSFHHRFVKIGLDVYPYDDFKVVYITNNEIRQMCNSLIG